MKAGVNMVDQSGMLGLWGTLAKNSMMWTDPTVGAGRGLVTDRVFFVGLAENIKNGLRRMVLQEGVDWATLSRTIPGINGPMQYVQIANNIAGSMGLPPLSENEQAEVRKLNAKRYLQVAGEQLGLELRPVGAAPPTPASFKVSMMVRAAYRNNKEEFLQFYREAVREYAKVVDDPVSSVKSSWKRRSPLENVFRYKPDDSTMRKLYRVMPEEGKESVQDALRLYDRYSTFIKD